MTGIASCYIRTTSCLLLSFVFALGASRETQPIGSVCISRKAFILSNELMILWRLASVNSAGGYSGKGWCYSSSPTVRLKTQEKLMLGSHIWKESATGFLLLRKDQCCSIFRLQLIRWGPYMCWRVIWFKIHWFECYSYPKTSHRIM